MLVDDGLLLESAGRVKPVVVAVDLWKKYSKTNPFSSIIFPSTCPSEDGKSAMRRRCPLPSYIHPYQDFGAGIAIGIINGKMMLTQSPCHDGVRNTIDLYISATGFLF